MGIAYGVTTNFQATKGIVQDGLVLNLDAGVKDSYNGGTTWRDLKNNNNGTLTNDPTFDLERGGGIAFDGTDDNVEIPHNTNQNLSASNGHSVSAWCKWISGSNHQDIVSKDSEGGSGREWLITKNNSGKFRFHIWSSGGSAIYDNSNYSLVSNQWVNVTQVWDGSILSCYVNGSLDKTKSASVTPRNTTTIMRIGGGSDSGSALHFNGSVSSVLVYQKALTAAEVSRNFNVMRHRFGI